MKLSVISTYGDFLPCGHVDSQAETTCDEGSNWEMRLDCLNSTTYLVGYDMYQNLVSQYASNRRWESSRDPYRHLHLATKWKNMETSKKG